MGVRKTEVKIVKGVKEIRRVPHVPPVSTEFPLAKALNPNLPPPKLGEFEFVDITKIIKRQ